MCRMCMCLFRCQPFFDATCELALEAQEGLHSCGRPRGVLHSWRNIHRWHGKRINKSPYVLLKPVTDASQLAAGVIATRCNICHRILSQTKKRQKTQAPWYWYFWRVPFPINLTVSLTLHWEKWSRGLLMGSLKKSNKSPFLSVCSIESLPHRCHNVMGCLERQLPMVHVVHVAKAFSRRKLQWQRHSVQVHRVY
jgi:hypothetical protein